METTTNTTKRIEEIKKHAQWVIKGADRTIADSLETIDKYGYLYALEWSHPYYMAKAEKMKRLAQRVLDFNEEKMEEYIQQLAEDLEYNALNPANSTALTVELTNRLNIEVYKEFKQAFTGSRWNF